MNQEKKNATARQDEEADDLVLGMYSKMQRTNKVKWRFAYSAVIMKIDSREYAYREVNGEFDWS